MDFNPPSHTHGPILTEQTDALIRASKRLAFEQARLALHPKLRDYFHDNPQCLANDERYKNMQADIVSIITTTLMMESSKL